VILKGSIDYMVSLHFLDFISWGVLDNGPQYCITLWQVIATAIGVTAGERLRSHKKLHDFISKCIICEGWKKTLNNNRMSSED
jgi:hypothetical protein